MESNLVYVKIPLSSVILIGTVVNYYPHTQTHEVYLLSQPRTLFFNKGGLQTKNGHPVSKNYAHQLVTKKEYKQYIKQRDENIKNLKELFSFN